MLAGEALQPLLALGGAEERQALHAAVFVGNHAVQHGEEVVQMALDGAALEQRGGIAERTDDAAVVRFQGELQIEFGRGIRVNNRAQLQTRQRGSCSGSVLPGEHDLEHRVRGQTPFRVERFDHLFEWYVLVILRGQCGAAHLRQQVGNGRRTA